MAQVSSKTSAKALAGFLADTVRESNECTLSAVGAAAVNQAVKAVAIARGYLAPNGMDLVVTPAFADFIDEEGATKTAMRLVVTARE